MALKRTRIIIATSLFIAGTIVSSLVAIFPNTSYADGTSSTSSCDYSYYENNDVNLYDRCQVICGVDSSADNSTNESYDNNEIVSDAQMGAVKANTAVYQAAGDAHGIPWQLLAAINLYENSGAKTGPSDGSGPYHDVAETDYPKGELTDAEFADATNKAAVELQTLAGSNDLTQAAGLNNVKSVVFSYTTNNSSLAAVKQLYIDQAKSLKFSDDEAARGEGSPDVMNRADSGRDSSKSAASTTWGWVQPGQTALSYPAPTIYGIAVIYAALANINLSNGGCLSGNLIPGGMTSVDQAKAFMRTYLSHVNDNEDQINKLLDKSHNWWWGNACAPPASPGLVSLGIPNLTSAADTTTHAAQVMADCTAFSAYFVNNFTSLRPGSSNGGTWTDSLISNNPGKNIPTGTVPQPYAVFSTNSSAKGHTGIILGVNTDKGTVIVGQMGCNDSLQWGYDNTKEYPLSTFSSGAYRYDYLGDFLTSGDSTGDNP